MYFVIKIGSNILFVSSKIHKAILMHGYPQPMLSWKTYKKLTFYYQQNPTESGLLI